MPRRFVSLLGATLLVAATASTGKAHFSHEVPPESKYLHSRMKLDAWPETVDTVYGFEWKASDYLQLAGFSQTSLTEIASDAYWKQDVGYACFITRAIEMENETGAKLKLTVTACRHYLAAKTRILYQYTSRTLTPNDTHGSTYGLELGDVSVIRDVPNNPEGFEGSQSNNLFFIRGNLLVECVLTESDPPSAGFTAAGLAAAMDVVILAQRQACGGDYPKPTASVEIENPNGDLRTLPPAVKSMTTDVSVTTSHPGEKPVKTKALVARWVEPKTMDDEGVWHPDPTRSPVWSVQNESSFVDDVNVPTKLTMRSGQGGGNFQLVIVAWGPNMVPVFATDDFTITRKP